MTDKKNDHNGARAQKERNPFDQTIQVLANRLRSYEMVSTLVFEAVDQRRQDISARTKKLLETHGAPVRSGKDDEGETISYVVPVEHHSKLFRQNRMRAQADLARSVMPRSLVVSMVSEFDMFISGIVRAMHALRPETFNDNQKSLTYAEIMSFSDMNELRMSLVNREVETLLRESHDDQLKWFEKKLKINLHGDKALIARFIELTERRNLYVHNDGRVNKQYLKECGQCPVPGRVLPRLGAALDPDGVYLRSAYELLIEVGSKLGQIIWRNLLPEQIEQADKNLIQLTFDLVAEGHYDLAGRLCSFGIASTTQHAQEIDRQYLILNLAQAQKWRQDNEACLSTLAQIDVSSCHPLISLAYHALREEYTECLQFMHMTQVSDALPKQAYYEWPVFRLLRRQDVFKAKYKELFGEEFREVDEGGTNLLGSPDCA